MRLSRTARFLIAALLLAAAAFVWVNLYNQTRQPTAPALADQGPAPVVVGDAAQPGAAGEPAATAEADGEAAADAAQPADGAEAAAPAGAQPLAPPVVVADGAPIVTRDLVVEELPFLVQGPPETRADATAEEGDAASRPQATRRATINPFSPVVVQAPPSAPRAEVAQAAPPAAPEVVEVVAGGQPASGGPAATPVVAQAPAQPVRAPAPRAVAPAGPVTAELPRALPGGVLPTTPQILRDTRSQAPAVEPVAPAPADLMALRVPDDVAEVRVAPVNAAAAPASASVPDPLGPGRVSAAARPSPAQVTPPLVVGADPLSRYLRDNDVRFTGTVLGPLSVGVFRGTIYAEPVILTLGQTLPDTDIILSDLRGYEARFTQGDRTHTLSLDLRR